MPILEKAQVFIEYPDEKGFREMVMLVEKGARLCYKTEGKLGEEPNRPFLEKRIETGHHSVIEHSMMSVRIICDRGVTHEIVRHRLAAYSQESTRYCDYSNDRFGGEIHVIVPVMFELTPDLDNEERVKRVALFGEWMDAMRDAERHYMKMRELGGTPQEARSVLPNSLKTEILMTANFREWRHFFKLRTAPAAHPQMQEVANMILEQVKAQVPVLFDDI